MMILTVLIVKKCIVYITNCKFLNLLWILFDEFPSRSVSSVDFKRIINQNYKDIKNSIRSVFYYQILNFRAHLMVFNYLI